MDILQVSALVFQIIRLLIVFFINSITTPGGLLIHMYGTEVGRRQDITLYRQNGMNLTLENNLTNSGVQYVFYGYPAKMLRTWFIVGYGREFATLEQRAFDVSM